MRISDVVGPRLSELRSFAGSFTWGPLVHLSRTVILTILKKIEIGSVKIVDVDNGEIICGRPQTCGLGPAVELKIRRDTFWVRMLLFADMGFAESYMLGEVSCRDLTSFFEIFILNKSQLSNGTTWTSSLSGSLSYLARSTNSLSNARLNISAHYDLGNDMFAAFLSPDMTYSCPIWLPKSHPKAELETLEDAQYRKLDMFINKAKIKKTDRVLEIGTGWGSLAIAAVKKTGCKVTSLTLSIEQKELAEQRIADAGLSDRIEVLLCDYRALKVPKEGPFDKIVSIEMLEAVGREYLTTYFQCINKLLKPEGGIACFQCITIPEARYEAYSKSTDFINQYIFPGGHLPSITQLVNSINIGSNSTLVIDSVLNIGAHYARTLHIWRENFLSNFDSIIKQSLLKEHGNMTEQDVETFRHKWEYYFTYCEAGFRTATLGDVIITVGREGARELIEDVPL